MPLDVDGSGAMMNSFPGGGMVGFNNPSDHMGPQQSLPPMPSKPISVPFSNPAANAWNIHK
jgi:hypothetical protein